MHDSAHHRAGAAGQRPRLRHAAAAFAGFHVLGVALSFVGSALTVRVATRETVASYLLLLQSIMAVSLVMQLGLAPALIRFAPLTRGRGGRIASGILRRRVFALQSCLWAAIVPPIAWAWPQIVVYLDAPELAGAGVLLIATALVLSLNQLMDAYLRAFRMYISSAALSHLVPRGIFVCSLLVLFAASRTSVSWDMLTTLYFGTYIVTATLYAVFMLRSTVGEESEARVATHPPGMRELFGTSTAMGLRSAAALLMTTSSLWILSWGRPHSEVAVFGVMASLIQVIGMVPLIVNQIIPQEFSVLYADGRIRQLERLVRSSATAVALLSLGGVIGLAVLGRALIRVAYGEAYVAGWSILMIMAVGRIVDAVAGSAGHILQTSGRHGLLLRFTLVAGIVNLVLCLALVVPYGGLGVALATALSLILLNVASVNAVRRELGVRTFAYLRPNEWMSVVRALIGGTTAVAGVKGG